MKNLIKKLQYIMLLGIFINKNMNFKFECKQFNSNRDQILNGIKLINDKKNDFRFFHYSGEEEGKIFNNIENLKENEILEGLRKKSIVKNYDLLKALLEKEKLIMIDAQSLYFPNDDTNNFFSENDNDDFFKSIIPEYEKRKIKYCEYMKKHDEDYKSYFPDKLLFDLNSNNMHVMSNERRKFILLSFYDQEEDLKNKNLIEAVLSNIVDKTELI